MPFRSGEQIDAYTIEKPLSKSGGMSQVFLAHHREKADKQVAIKVQLTEDENSQTYQELLRQEAETLSRLRHPGIVHVFPLRVANRTAYSARAHEHKGQPWYFAMEYIRGNNLHDYTGQIAKMPLEWVMELFYQLLTTIQFMHLSGFAHCDLKPNNILLRSAPSVNEVPRPVLVDFGSATEIKKGIGQLTASLHYSPPEVILAMERKDIPQSNLLLLPEKIDIWALGAILFEIVTGRPLINKKKKDDITTSIIKGELDTIHSIRPDVHHSLDRFLGVILRKDPAERPDVRDLIKAIEEKISVSRPPRVGQSG